MARKRNRNHSKANQANDKKPQQMEAFTFGDPTPVLDQRDLLGLSECYEYDGYYQPPVSYKGLAKALRSAVQHESCIDLKANMLASTFVPHKLLDRKTFKALAMDYLVFGNAHPRCIRNRLGKPLKLERMPAKYTRVRCQDPGFVFVPRFNVREEYEPHEVGHIMRPDIDQEIYGKPNYMSALNSALLNESATIFRRRYYENGSHAGFILYVSDPAQNEDDIKNMRQALKDSKGPGNFRNLFMYSPNGKKDGIQLIPISEIQAKDDFMNIKNVSQEDLLNAHRVPPILVGSTPRNAGGFGSPRDAAAIFYFNEVQPLQSDMQAINDWLGQEVVTFQDYNPPESSNNE